MSHTPGPWKIEKNRAPNGGTYYRIYDKEEVGSCIAQIIGDSRIEYHDNARLIAAAPELLEVLEQCLELLDNSDTRYYISHELGEMSKLHATLNQTKKAITKAKGV